MEAEMLKIPAVSEIRRYDIIEASGKRIRDAIHGDIIVPKQFQEIINTTAFQRMRRVRQLATAQYAFPSADHTRFAHSLGAFEVMRQIVDHFSNYFGSIGLSDKFNENYQDQLLAAALLHDLGHAPFSHALEKGFPGTQRKSHEDWTAEIIQNDPELNGVLVEHFGVDGVNAIVKLLRGASCAAGQADGDRDTVRQSADGWLEPVLHSFISSQLDADRLDYILRDSRTIGVSYGEIDIQRLIGSLRIGIKKDGNCAIGVAEKHLSDIENYFYSRYQMYCNVYLKPFKVMTELLLQRILQNASYLYEHDILQLEDVPDLMRYIIKDEEISLGDYMNLDDAVIMNCLMSWSKMDINGDPDLLVLQELCGAFINRSRFTRVKLNNDAARLHYLKREIFQELFPGKTANELEDMIALYADELPFFISKQTCVSIYDSKNQPVYIFKESGELVPLDVASNISRISIEDDKNEKQIVIAYFSKDILACYLRSACYRSISGKNNTKEEIDILESIEKIIDSSEKQVEVEKKYCIQGDYTVGQINKVLEESIKDLGYTINGSGSGDQTDCYYDTDDQELSKREITLRIRSKGSDYRIACKKPIKDSSSGIEGQMERYEYERKINSDDITSVQSRDFIKEYLSSEFPQMPEFRNRIIIFNHRTTLDVTKILDAKLEFKEQYEIVIDDVEYRNPVTNRTYKEKQIEIELKSEAITRLNMLMFTEALEEKLKSIEPVSIDDSKYARALAFTK